MSGIKLLWYILVIVVSFEHGCAIITKSSEFIIHEDKICSAQNITENTESHSVHECSVQCMTGADCVGFTYQDGRCSFVPDVVYLAMSVQTGAKCVLSKAGKNISELLRHVLKDYVV